jgi:hypothetical protein
MAEYAPPPRPRQRSFASLQVDPDNSIKCQMSRS